MQVPITKYLGASMGLVPYSSVGYAFGNKIEHGAMSNQGSGGINQAYLGVGGTYAGVSLGVNVSYNFGTIQNDVFSTPTATGRSLFEHVMQVRDWDINLGLQYTARIQRFHKMTVGLTWSPKKSLHGDSWASIQELTHESRPDTVGKLGLSGNYYQPMSLGFGLNYTYEKGCRVMAEIDGHFQQWSKAKFSPMYSLKDPKSLVFEGMNFVDRYKISAGAEIVPKLRGNYGQRISYRLGAYFTRDYLNINGNTVREYGLTAGFGLPTVEGKTMINLGFEWKRRKGHPQALISENYFNIMLGVNFNELWFWQRKIK